MTVTRTTALRRSVLVSAITIALIGTGMGNALAITPEDLDSVPQIDWTSLRNPQLTEAQTTMPKVLARSNEYALGEWWQKKFAGQDDQEYLTFGGRGEHNIRHPAAQAMALATALQTGVYDPEITGVSEEEARSRATKLVVSLAKAHVSNTAGGWSGPDVSQVGGNPTWQSALWASTAATAGWFLWDDLTDEQRMLIGTMAEYEGNRFLDYTVPVWYDWSGKGITPEDSKVEENSWNGLAPQIASVMFPQHENRAEWTRKTLELMISSSTMPQDANSTTLINDKTARDWASGYNVAQDGTVVNHGFMHPDYMAAAVQQMYAMIPPALAGQKSAEGMVHNIPKIYQAFDSLDFQPPQYRAPGGTIYMPGSGEIYWPKGTDWGTARRMNFAAFDALASTLGLDTESANKGDYWLQLHGDAALASQARSSDGRMYTDPTTEDPFVGAEEWVAWHAAMATLAPMVAQSGKLNRSNGSVEDLLTNDAPVEPPRRSTDLLRVGHDRDSGRWFVTSDYGLRESVSVDWLGYRVTFFPGVEVDGQMRPNYIGLPTITRTSGFGLLPSIGFHGASATATGSNSASTESTSTRSPAPTIATKSTARSSAAPAADTTSADTTSSNTTPPSQTSAPTTSVSSPTTTSAPSASARSTTPEAATTGASSSTTTESGTGTIEATSEAPAAPSTESETKPTATETKPTSDAASGSAEVSDGANESSTKDESSAAEN